MRRVFLGGLGCLFALRCVASCAEEEEPGSAAPGPDASADVGKDSPPLFFDAGQDAGCYVCSADLHQVLDCAGNVLQTCPGDQGCSPKGTCVSPCDAAADNQSSIGCDYFAFTPYAYEEDGESGCFAVFVANTWNAPVTLTVERNGRTYDPSAFSYVPSGSGQSITYTPIPDGQLPPHEVAILFFGASPGSRSKCPAPAALNDTSMRRGSGYGYAFHIGTSAPVVAYDIFPYGGGNSALTSATLLLPSSSWGTNYVATTAARPTGRAEFPSWITLVGREDGTTVTLSPTADIEGGATLPPSAKDSPRKLTLDRGEILQFAQMADLTGTPILADKPIGVWGGNTCMWVPDSVIACDTAHQQLPPVRALGSEYVAVRYRDRFDGKPESPPYRLLGVVDDTSLVYTPAKPEGAPDTLARGDVVEFDAGDPFVVRSQDADHPFYMAGYMTGAAMVNDPSSLHPDGRGDPEFVNVIPPKQFMRSYTFFTDPTYSETNLVVVRTKTAEGTFAPVHLDCAGDLTDWQPVGPYEWTRVDLVRHDFAPQKYDGGECNNGRHVITSDQPFGVTVWGWGSEETGGDPFDASAPGFYTQWVSYAYPAGAAVRPLTSVEVLPVPK